MGLHSNWKISTRQHSEPKEEGNMFAKHKIINNKEMAVELCAVHLKKYKKIFWMFYHK